MKKSEVATIKKTCCVSSGEGFPSTPTHEPEAVYEVAKGFNESEY